MNTTAQTEERIAGHVRAYRRTLAQWAQDVLALRVGGRDKPGYRRSRRLLATTAGTTHSGRVNRRAA